MAKYPLFDEYAKTGKYAEGVKRCNDLLKRTPKDVQLLVTKLRLLCAIPEDHTETLNQLLAFQPTVTHTAFLFHVQEAIVGLHRDEYPPILTAGPIVNKLWDNALKAVDSEQDKMNLIAVRFNSAVEDNRIQDCQQVLIAVKSLMPRNRAMYMAHAAYTQLLSTSTEDLQSRLAISLARKAVVERFDDDKALDCRVPGQIFACQKSEKDLESIRHRRIRESKQVYRALRLSEPHLSNGGAPLDPSPTVAANYPSREWLEAEVVKAKQDFAGIVDSASEVATMAFLTTTTKLFRSAVTVLDLGGRDRGAADACFLAISGLVQLWSTAKEAAYLLQAAYLADRLLKHNENFHEARLILVYLYMELGLGSLAIVHFESLKIKEVQFDTVGHTLFTKISLLQPFKSLASPRSDLDTHEVTLKALNVYIRHEEKLASCESEILNHGQTGMIFDLQELRTSLRTSLTRRTHVLEHRRLSRLTGRAPGKRATDIGPRKLANWTNYQDTRDFQAAFNFGLNVEKALSDTRSTDEETLHKLAADTAWSLATSQRTLITDLPALDQALLALPSSSTPTSPTRLLAQLCSINGAVASGPGPSAGQIDALIQTTAALLPTPLPAGTPLQTTFLHLDHVRILLQTCRHIADRSTDVPGEVQRLQERGREWARGIRRYAQEQAGRTTGLGDGLRRDGRLAEFGEGSVREFGEMVGRSAREGWEAVGRVSVPGM